MINLCEELDFFIDRCIYTKAEKQIKCLECINTYRFNPRNKDEWAIFNIAVSVFAGYCKRNQFYQEREIRILTNPSVTLQEYNNRKYYPFDLSDSMNRLIKEIITGPYMNTSNLAEMGKILQDYKLNCKIIKATIPLY